MLNPCNPCVYPGAPCEQCQFGYNPAAENHERMKKLLLKYMSTDEPFSGRGSAELYIKWHNDWKEEIGDIPEAKTEKKENRFTPLAKDVRELYVAFRVEGFTEDEAVELTKTYLGIAFQDQMYRNMREPRKLNKSELAARLNRYKKEHKEEEKS